MGGVLSRAGCLQQDSPSCSVHPSLPVLESAAAVPAARVWEQCGSLRKSEVRPGMMEMTHPGKRASPLPVASGSTKWSVAAHTHSRCSSAHGEVSEYLYHSCKPVAPRPAPATDRLCWICVGFEKMKSQIKI